jgi:Divergent InlB B-repeat domain
VLPRDTSNGRSKRLQIQLGVLLLLVLFLAASAGVWVGGASTGRSSGPSNRADSPSTAAASGALGVHPSTGSSGNFFQVDSNLTDSAFANQTCFTGVDSDCFSYATNPTLLDLSGSDLGIAYDVFTNTSLSLCGNPAVDQIAHVAFERSTNGGASWGTPLYLGDRAGTCPYNNELFPSFTTNGSGGIDGVYLGANATASGLGGVNQSFCGPICCPRCHSFVYDPEVAYNFSQTAIIFTNSSDEGTSFAAGTTLLTGSNLSDPQIAAVGQTIYIVYEDLNNGTTLIGPRTYTSMSVEMIRSENGGSTWSAPTTLPGLNASDAYSAGSPAIAVSTTGTLAVTYVTDRTCLANCSSAGTNIVYGDDIVVATSTNNGTTWARSTVRHAAGESGFAGIDVAYDTKPLEQLFQLLPSVAVAWDGSSLLTAWTASYNESNIPDHPGPFDMPGLFSGVSTNGGSSWTSELVAGVGANYTPSIGPFQEGPGTNYPFAAASFVNPSIAVSNGTVYLSFEEVNRTSSNLDGSFCGVDPPSALGLGVSGWLATSTTGVSWNSPALLGSSTDGETSIAYYAFSSSTVVVAGAPVVAMSVPVFPAVNGPRSTISVATAYTGTFTNVTVDERGLPANAPWSIAINGESFATNGTTITVASVPIGTPVLYTPSSDLWIGGTQYFGPDQTWITPGSAPVVEEANFTAVVPLTLGYGPTDPNSVNFEVGSFALGWSYSMEDAIENYFPVTSSFSGCPSPWYVPLGQPLNVTDGLGDNGGLAQNLTYVPSTGGVYWSGLGAGNYTGDATNFTFTPTGAVTEVLWQLPYGNYSQEVNATGLPSGAPFQFAWDGTVFDGTAGTPTIVPGALTGPHWITNISASPFNAPWDWIGSVVGGNPVLVPIDPVAQVSFAQVEVGTPTGTITFHAPALPPSTPWSLELNGTWYGADTPWINVTAHSGDYAIAASPAVAANGTSGFLPTGISPYWNVTPGHTYLVNYTTAYSLTVLSGLGGSTSQSGTEWLHPGAIVALDAATQGSGYGWAGWTGTGPGSYSGTAFSINVTVSGPIVESANFYPLPADRYSLTVTEAGLPSGTDWGVVLDDVPYSSTNASITIGSLLSCSTLHYTLTVPYLYGMNATDPNRYVPGSYPSSVCEGGTTELAFSEQAYLTLETTANGSATARLENGPTGGSAWFDLGSGIDLVAVANPGARFLGWNGTGPGNYTGTDATPTIDPTGTVTEVAAFAGLVPPPVRTYSLTFLERTTLAEGTAWSVNVSGSGYASTGASIVLTGLTAGKYPVIVPGVFAPDRLTDYQPVNQSFTVPLSANQTVFVSYTSSYWVSVTSSGPGVAAPGSGWVGAGKTIYLQAQAGLGAQFEGWAGSGSSAYAGSAIDENVTVVAPITEVASFAFASAPAGTSAPGSIWSSPTVIAVVAVALLIVGLLVGLVLFRRRPGAPPSRGGPDSGSTELTPSETPAARVEPSEPEPDPDEVLPYGDRSAVGSRTFGRVALVAVAIVAVLLLSGLGMSMTSDSRGASRAPLLALTTPTFHGASAPARPGSFSPASGPGIFPDNVHLPNVTTNSICLLNSLELYNTSGCGSINETDEPSANLTSRGLLAVAYTAYTNDSPCDATYPGLVNATLSEIGVTVSRNDGRNWSVPEYLGNDNCTSLNVANKYLNAWEPALTSLANGTLVLAYIQFNQSAGSFDLAPELFQGESDFWSSRLVVTESYDNGSTWTPPTAVFTSPIASGIASDIVLRPSIAASGKTLYLAYTNLTNDWSSDGAGDAIGDSGARLSVSTNGGTTWHAAIKLPVVPTNHTARIAANAVVRTTPNGTVLVAYVTAVGWNSSLLPDAQCDNNYWSNDEFNDCGEGGYVSNIEVGKSFNNGTGFTWGLAAANVTDTLSYTTDIGIDLAPSQIVPQPELAWDNATGQVAIVYTGDISYAACDPVDGCNNFTATRAFTANASLSAWQFENRTVDSWETLSNGTYEGLEASYVFNPSIVASSSGTIYISAQFVNGSACTNITPTAASYQSLGVYNLNGYVYSEYCGATQELISESLDNATSFSPPILAYTDPGNWTWFTDMPPGFESSMVSAGPEVWVAWTQTTCPGWNLTAYGNCFYWDGPPVSANTSVVVSAIDTSPSSGITLNFTATGLPAGATWSVRVSGNERTGLAGATLSASGVPIGVNETWNASYVAAGPGARYYAMPGGPHVASYASNTAITVHYVLEYGVTVSTTPALPQAYTLNASWDYFWFSEADTCTAPVYAWNDSCATAINYNLSAGPGATWVASGGTLTLGAIPLNASEFACGLDAGPALCPGGDLPYLNLTFLSWTGVGAGATNTTANATTLVVRGPINETANFLLNGYCEWTSAGTPGTWNSSCPSGLTPYTFTETGLPSGTTWGVADWGSPVPTGGPLVNTTNTSTLVAYSEGSNVTLSFAPLIIPASGGQEWVATANPGSPLMAPIDSVAHLRYSLEPATSAPVGVDVQAIGLPNATNWSVGIGGSELHGNGEGTVAASLTGGSQAINVTPLYGTDGVENRATAIEVEPLTENGTSSRLAGPNSTFDFSGWSWLTLVFSPLDRVTVQASTGGTVSAGSQWVPNGGTLDLTASANPGWEFTGWSGDGNGSVSGTGPSIVVHPQGPVSELASFNIAPLARYSLVVDSIGLPPGSVFTLDFNDSAYQGASGFSIPPALAGDYPIAVPTVYANGSDLEEFVPSNFTTTLSAGPGGTYDLSEDGWVNVTFSIADAVEVSTSGSGSTAPASGITWMTSGRPLALTATPSAGNEFVGWIGTGQGSVSSLQSSITVTPLGPITEVAEFAPKPAVLPATYALSIEEMGLPSSTPWSFSAGSTAVSGTGSTLAVRGLNGTYAISIPMVLLGATLRYAPNASALNESVSANETLEVTFAAEYRVTLDAGAGGNVSSGPRWSASGAAIGLEATPSTGFEFIGWNGSGPGNYTGTDANPTIHPTGPVTELAEFGPILAAPPSHASGSSGPSLGSIALLAVALVIGLALGILVARRRRRSPPADGETTQRTEEGWEGIPPPAEPEESEETPVDFELPPSEGSGSGPDDSA